MEDEKKENRGNERNIWIFRFFVDKTESKREQGPKNKRQRGKGRERPKEKQGA